MSRTKSSDDAIVIPPVRTLEQLLLDLGCVKVTRPQSGFLCDGLPDFGIGEWTHPDLDKVAVKYGEVYQQLSDEGFRMSIQGIADSRPPTGELTWEADVNGKKFYGAECKRGNGELINEDFAWLRSCSVRNAIQSKYGHSVSVLPPEAHTEMENLTSKEYRAVRIYLVSSPQ